MMPATLVVRNHSSRSLRGTWRNFDGTDGLAFSLLPDGGQHIQPTYIGHGWCFSDAETGAFATQVIVTETTQQLSVY